MRWRQLLRLPIAPLVGCAMCWGYAPDALAQPAPRAVTPPPTAPAKTKQRAAPAPQPVRTQARLRPISRPRARPAAPTFRPAPPKSRVAAKPKPTEARRSGLALHLALGTSAQVHAGVMATAAYPGLNGRFMLGWRIGRVTLGLGLEFVRTMSKDSTGEERNAHIVLFRPTLEVGLWQPWPLSLYLTVGAHGGFLGTAGRNVVDDELPAVGFHGGLGVRYFLHPRFALGMEGGFQGVWLVDDDGDKTVDGTVLFYGAVVLLAIL